MKIVCQKNELVNSVNIVMKAVPAKTTMPILECIIIDALDGVIKLVSNDMEMGIETLVRGEIAEEGEIAINARIFSEIVRKLPDSEITMETDDKYVLTIKCENSVFSITGKSSEEFPSLPEFEKNDAFVMSQYTLKEIVRQTVFAISDNESNKIMTGELFEIKNGLLRVVALDGHRIAIRKVELKEAYPNKKVIIPGKALNEISKILSGESDKEVRIYFTNMHAVFEFDDTIVLSRLIDGEYFKIDQMIKNDYETKIVINKKELLNSIDRVSPLIKETEKKPIVINVNGDSFEISISTNIGKMDDKINVIKEGKDILIGFNPKFIYDVLRVVDDEEIFIYMTNAKAPCFIRSAEETYNYLILPVTINIDK